MPSFSPSFQAAALVSFCGEPRLWPVGFSSAGRSVPESSGNSGWVCGAVEGEHRLPSEEALQVGAGGWGGAEPQEPHGALPRTDLVAFHHWILFP